MSIKSKTDLAIDVNTYIQNNGQNAITGTILNQRLIDFIDSFQDILDVTNLTDLGDVNVLSGLTNGCFLVYSGGTWIPDSLSITNFYTKTQCNNNFLSANTSFYTQVECNNNFLSANTYTPKLINRYFIGSHGHFPNISSAITWLNVYMSNSSEIFIDGGSYDITDTITINLPYNLHIRGIASDSTYIKANTGLINKPMFNIYSECSFEKLTLSGSSLSNWGSNTGENFINIYGNNLYSEFQNMIFDKSYKAINLVGNSEIFVFNSIIQNISYAGIMVNSNDVNSIDIETNTFYNCYFGIFLYSGVSSTFYVMNNIFTNSGNSQIAIEYNPPYYTYSDHPNIQGNEYNDIGTFIDGFDFTRTDSRDANIYAISNVGIEDKKPHCKINVKDNSGITAVSVANKFYKAVFTNTNSYTCKFTITNNRFTYQPTNRRDLMVLIGGNLSVDQNNRNIDVCLVKNGNSGTTISPFTVRTSTANQVNSFSIAAYLQDSSVGDYYEIWVTSQNAGDNVILSDLTILVWSI